MSKELKKWPLSQVTLIPLDSIDRNGETLQTRHIEALKGSDSWDANHGSQRNVKELTQELRRLNEGKTEDYRQGHLDPIVVWRDPEDNTGKYIIVAGFHRYDAYQEYNKSQGKTPKNRKKKIPAHVFRGTHDKARLFSANQDTQPNLTKTTRQKLNAAWADILNNNEDALKLSGRQLAGIYAISRSEINKMRIIKKQLNENPSLKTNPDWKTQKWLIENPDAEIAAKDESAMIEALVAKLHVTLFVKTCQGDKDKLMRVIRGLCESAGIGTDITEEILGPMEDEDEEDDF